MSGQEAYTNANSGGPQVAVLSSQLKSAAQGNLEVPGVVRRQVLCPGEGHNWTPRLCQRMALDLDGVSADKVHERVGYTASAFA